MISYTAINARMAANPGLGRVQAYYQLRAEKQLALKNSAHWRKWRRDNQARIERMADEDWNALSSQVDPVDHAKQHLAEMPAEKRAALQAEWDA